MMKNKITYGKNVYNQKEIFAVNKVLKNSTQMGKSVQTFEKKIASHFSKKYGLMVNSGSSALTLAFKVMNFPNSSEVITPCLNFGTAVSSIVLSNLVPMFVDCKKETLQIDEDKIEKKITSKTKCLLIPNLIGNVPNWPKIKKIAKKYNLKIIEDCAQAQGAKYKNKYVGTIGDLGCFSFYPTKILGAYGDGGFIFTKKKDLHKKIRRLRFYGIETIEKKNKFYNKYYANENGINSRIDEIQCSILNVKLNLVDKFINKRIQLAKEYFKHLAETDLILPYKNYDNKHVYHLFTVYHPKKKEVIKLLNKKNIKTRTIYPYPIQTMKAYKNLNFKKNLKNSEKKSKGIFCLPLYPEMNKKDVIKISNTIKNILITLKS